MGLSKFVVTAMLSIKNQASFDRTHLKQFEQDKRINGGMFDIQNQVNHKQSNMTNLYNRMSPEELEQVMAILQMQQALKDKSLDR
ncbi:hypothetical protein [Diaphorobacter aerolatus]|uniref:Uncharacterized protein n=1 Tax=Diaphorobacter aerolatus TaxID=1288495 RepID=A0A7H0GJ83_9BURK|nr:hypothetical protein [Diaphorobacter aerolatus]QNP48349.1 hypothetical protein H9K75_20735 [Diaphorobacter aerolatus]